jgi:hypothetical protein
MASAKEYINEALSIAMYAMRSAIHSTMGSSPGSLKFNRDMFLKIPLIADWHMITQKREHRNGANTTMPLNKECLRKNENLAS